MSNPAAVPLWQTIPDNQLVRLLDRSHTLNGAVLVGLDGLTIEIQARAMNVEEDGLPWRKAVKISGMAKGAVGEALDRISGAFRATGIPDPKVEILINLTPPDVPKDGTWLDLPLAIIMLQAAGYLPDLPDHKEGDYIVAGELGLHGEVRRVPGVLSLAYMAKAGQKLIVPTGNEKEAALILAKPGHEGCGVYPVSLLSDVTEFFAGRRTLENALKQRIVFESVVERSVDFGKIRGQETAKEAALLAAAGGHNLLLIGPPGEGKSLLASAMPGILPRLNDAEKVQLTRIYSASGALEKDGQAVTRRPMRSIHHTASKQSIVGGGTGVPRPGEITMGLYGARAVSSAPTEDEVSPKLRARVEAARTRQRERFQGTEIAFNAAIPGGSVIDYCRLSPAALEHYKATIDANTLSTRSMDRLAKVARTAADLAESETTEPEHIDAAARFVIGGTLRENF